ncbi:MULTISPECIES: outer membrane beta-barrel protein [unclassified Helicobacter]|uniref:outer membrane beta-barrel protein n=1 Tax=unclassified Helicobacter TaxID=2593540 RepID=UPI000CF17582|nr:MULTISPECIES: outer membrane beta-barrel protein [unclassified Helicobacter]
MGSGQFIRVNFILIASISYIFAKDGFFFGYENEFGILNISHQQRVSTFATNSYIPLSIKNPRGINYVLGFLGGYELYFKNKQDIPTNHGLRIGLKLQMGYATMELNTISKDLSQQLYSHLDFGFLTIKTGISAQYIWNFFQKNNTSIGFLSGLNIDVNYFKGTSEFLDGIYGVDRPVFYNIGFYPNIGVLFQTPSLYFSLTYRIGPIGGLFSTYTHYPILETSMPGIGKYQYYVENEIDFSSFFSFGIGYRF